MAGTMKRWLTWLLSGVLAASLVVGVAFAGTTGSNGDNRLNNDGNNYKNGTDNKKTRGCPTGYSLTGSYLGYDLNGDGWVCYETLNDGTVNVVDNTSNS